MPSKPANKTPVIQDLSKRLKTKYLITEHKEQNIDFSVIYWLGNQQKAETYFQNFLSNFPILVPSPFHYSRFNTVCLHMLVRGVRCCPENTSIKIDRKHSSSKCSFWQFRILSGKSLVSKFSLGIFS